jgi:hypothetical protein
MKILKIFFLICFLISSLSQPALAGGNDLWDAIAAWEDKDHEKAARLFVPFERAHPIARPYIEDLVARGLYQAERFPYFYDPMSTNIAHGWYEASCIMRKAKEIERDINELSKKPAKKEKELASLNKSLKETLTRLCQLPTAGGAYIAGLWINKASGKSEKVQETTTRKYVESINVGLNACLDPRAILVFKDPKNKTTINNNLRVCEIANT